MSIAAAFFILVLIGGGFVALLNTQAGEIGCQLVLALLGLAMIGAVVLFWGLIGGGCVAAMFSVK